jgi:hypothetical protein
MFQNGILPFFKQVHVRLVSLIIVFSHEKKKKLFEGVVGTILPDL